MLKAAEKTNWDLISFNQELFDAAMFEVQEEFKLQGLDPDDVGFKDMAKYVNSKPYPWTPKIRN